MVARPLTPSSPGAQRATTYRDASDRYCGAACQADVAGYPAEARALRTAAAALRVAARQAEREPVLVNRPGLPPLPSKEDQRHE